MGWARLLFWVALLTMLPVPLVLVGRGCVPAAAMAELAAVTLSVGLLERADGAVGTLAVILLLQAVLWGAILWIAARLVVRGIRRMGARSVGRVTLALVVTMALVAAVTPIYRSPFHATRARQTLVEVYR